MTASTQALPTTPQLADLVTAIGSEVDRGGDWRRTAQRVAGALRLELPRPEALAADLSHGQDGPRSRLLHVEPDGAFSIQAIVWPAGRITPVHDHVSWCVFGVIEGALDEELFTLADGGDHLVRAGRTVNTTGAVTGFAPPGDLHRVANPGEHTAISIHVYGTDLSRIGSSALRYYDLPIRP
jgi:predicted metal-dependent enzyme (double-stranded beta helix superfamily)